MPLNPAHVKNNSYILRAAGCVTLVIFSFAVKAQKVSADYDGHVDFTKYKTFAWLAPGDSVLNRYRKEKLYGGYITYAANNELKMKGMRPDSLRPSAIFVFETQVNEFTKYTQGPTLSVGVGVAGPGYYVGGSAPVAGGKITASTANDGILGYAMYDAQTGKLLWSGKMEKTFSMSDDLEKIIGEATKKIFKTLPKKKPK